MSEIKFRGKERYVNKWVYGYYGELTDGNIVKIFIMTNTINFNPHTSIYFTDNEVIPETVGQFTGLYDDNGEEIYEGNLVEIKDEMETKTSYISEVYFTYDGVLVDGHPVHVSMGVGKKRLLSHYCDYGVGGKYNVSCKIVGNIYER